MSKCIGCNTPIPAGASKCPMCGAPTIVTSLAPSYVPPPRPIPIMQAVTEVHHHHQYTQPDKPVLIEATSKKWKKMYLYAWVFFFLSFMGCVAGAGDKSGPVMTFSGISFLIGVGLYIRARAGAWWNHG